MANEFDDLLNEAIASDPGPAEPAAEPQEPQGGGQPPHSEAPEARREEPVRAAPEPVVEAPRTPRYTEEDFQRLQWKVEEQDRVINEFRSAPRQPAPPPVPEGPPDWLAAIENMDEETFYDHKKRNALMARAIKESGEYAVKTALSMVARGIQERDRGAAEQKEVYEFFRKEYPDVDPKSTLHQPLVREAIVQVTKEKWREGMDPRALIPEIGQRVRAMLTELRGGAGAGPTPPATRETKRKPSFGEGSSPAKAAPTKIPEQESLMASILAR